MMSNTTTKQLWSETATTTSEPIDPTKAVEPLYTLSEFWDQLEPISPAAIRLDRKMCWGEWGKLSKVSLYLKEHILTTPFFASRLDLHCVDCIMCHVCFENLPEYIKPFLNNWKKAKGLPENLDNARVGRTCRYCLPCEECSIANEEILGDRNGSFHFDLEFPIYIFSWVLILELLNLLYISAFNLLFIFFLVINIQFVIQSTFI